MIHFILLFAIFFSPNHIYSRGHRREVCPGATYFYERHHPQPAWARNMVVVCVIQDHVFLRKKVARKESL